MALDPAELIGHWGYLAIVGFAVAGTAGLPVPEESVLVAAGYLAWRGALRLPLVIAVGVVSAVAGDNLGIGSGGATGAGSSSATAATSSSRPSGSTPPSGSSPTTGP